MEISRSGFNFQDDDIRRQKAVESSQYFFRRFTDLVGASQVSYLSECMNTGIGSTCSLHLHVAMKYRDRSFAQLAHNRSGILLFLPSAVPRSVVLEKKFEGVQFVDLLMTSACELIRSCLNSDRISIMGLIMGVRPPRAPGRGFPERMKVLELSSGKVPTLW